MAAYYETASRTELVKMLDKVLSGVLKSVFVVSLYVSVFVISMS